MSAEEETLVALKEQCLASCGGFGDKLADPDATADERAQAAADQAEAHQAHAESLASAYRAFQERSGDVSEPNPAVGEVGLEAHLTVEAAVNQ